jgi:transposase
MVKGEGLPDPAGFELRSSTVGALPIVNALCDRLGIDDLLAKAVAGDPRATLPPAASLGALARNLVEARAPLYALGEWAAERDLALLGLPGGAGALNDDRVGRALDRPFDADRASLSTEVAVAAIRRFGVSLDELHSDSTSITLTGRYPDADGRAVRGTKTAKIARGHNKDHRPDLKQLLWVLTVSADGAAPVHHKVADGNTEDSTTHIETWDTLVGLAGRPDFLYVADSKPATRENMGHIDRLGGRFPSALPRSRTEDGDFREWVVDHTPDWELARNQGAAADGGPDVYFMTEAPWPSGEGYRVAWVLSGAKARRDAESRRSRIKRASERLDELAARLSDPKARIRAKAGAAEAAASILKDTSTERFFEIVLEEADEPGYRQERRGRPGPRTRCRRSDRKRIALS